MIPQTNNCINLLIDINQIDKEKNISKNVNDNFIVIQGGKTIITLI